MKLLSASLPPLSSIAVAFLSLATSTPDNRRPWDFKAHHYYDSKIYLCENAFNATISSVFDKNNDQLVRVIPYGLLDTKKSEFEEKSVAEADQVICGKNLVQIFSADLSRHHDKFIGPCNCPISTLDAFYSGHTESPGFSSSSSTSKSTTSTNTDQALKTYLNAGCPDAAAIFRFPCLTEKCRYDPDGVILKTIATAEGLTYVLFSDHLDVIDVCCKLVRSLPSFDYGRQTWTTALDFVLDERNYKMAIAFEGFYYVVIDYSNFAYYYSQYMFGEPVSPPFRLFPSGMILPGIYYFRFIFDGETFYVWNQLFDCKSANAPSPQGGYVPDTPKGKGPVTNACFQGPYYPAWIADYTNAIDILVGRESEYCDTVWIYSSQAVFYNLIAKECQVVRIPKQTWGYPVSFTNAKVQDKNEFYISFTSSLDIIQFKYAPIA
jgi:hypothetical protein